MTRRDRRRQRALTRGKGQRPTPQVAAQTRLTISFARADRKALLLGTALASTLLIATATAPTPASAQATCQVGQPGVPAPPGPIDIDLPGDSIDCVNVFDRNNGAEDQVILLQTDGAAEFIVLDNSGNLTATNAAGSARGINAATLGANSNITVSNSGDIAAISTYAGPVGTGIAAGINAYTFGGRGQ